MSVFSTQSWCRKIWSSKNIISILLCPYSLLYLLGHLINYYLLQYPRRVAAYVICIGNLTVGGSGKTPYAIYLAKQKMLEGYKVAFISRGYKGAAVSNHAAIRVEVKHHLAAEVGDEPLLLAQVAPVYVSSNRYIAAQAAVQDGAEVIIMDDGLQNNTIHKDESVIVFDSVNGLGNGFMLPAGPLREPASWCLQAVDRVVIIGKGPYNISHPNTQRLMPRLTNLNKIGARECILITGIANSNRVLIMLRQAGVRVVRHFDFPDHHSFTDKEAREIKGSGNLLITTAKDYLRMPQALRASCMVLEYELYESAI